MSTDKSYENELSGRYLWYFLTLGVLCGAVIIVMAVLPQTITGFALAAALVLFALINRISRRFSSSRIRPHFRGARGITYLVIVGAVFVAALVLDWAIVRRGDALWLAWIMAVVVFAVVAIGTWIAEGHPADKQPSAI